LFLLVLSHISCKRLFSALLVLRLNVKTGEKIMTKKKTGQHHDHHHIIVEQDVVSDIEKELLESARQRYAEVSTFDRLFDS
jgi:hypothetical protein